MGIFRAIDSSGYLVRTARGVAWVSGAFGLIMSVLLIANYIQLATADPLDNPVLSELRRTYSGDQSNGPLKTQIRALDLMARKAFFIRTWQLRAGGYMLLGAAILFLASMRIISAATRPLPHPVATQAARKPQRVRRSLFFAGIAIVSVALAFAVLADRRYGGGFPGEMGLTNKDEGSMWSSLPAEVTANWPSFRGPGGLGVADGQDPPTAWDMETGENIMWITPVPLPGTGSPVVWDDRVFLSGSDGTVQGVYCWDAFSGEMLWTVNVGPFPGSPLEMPDLSLGAGYAAPTPATDGERLYVIYASGDLAGVSFDGELIWGVNLGNVDEIYGHAASLIVYDDILIVQYDHDNSAALMGLSTLTGAIDWEVARDVYASWSSPVLIPTERGMELIVTASPYMASYDPKTGAEYWRIEGMLGEVASSAAFAGENLIVINQLLSIWNIDPGEAALRWEVYDDLPDTSSPLAFDGTVVIATSFGGVFALDSESGDVLWREELPHGFYSSPIKAGEAVYLMDRQGVMHIYTADGNFTPISHSTIGEPSDATPAFKHNLIYIRGEKNLFCIGPAGDG